MFCYPESGNPSSCLLVFQSKIKLNHNTQFFRLPNLDYYCSMEPLKGHGDWRKKTKTNIKSILLHSLRNVGNTLHEGVCIRLT